MSVWAALFVGLNRTKNGLASQIADIYRERTTYMLCAVVSHQNDRDFGLDFIPEEWSEHGFLF